MVQEQSNWWSLPSTYTTPSSRMPRHYKASFTMGYMNEHETCTPSAVMKRSPPLIAFTSTVRTDEMWSRTRTTHSSLPAEVKLPLSVPSMKVMSTTLCSNSHRIRWRFCLMCSTRLHSMPSRSMPHWRFVPLKKCEGCTMVSFRKRQWIRVTKRQVSWCTHSPWNMLHSTRARK